MLTRHALEIHKTRVQDMQNCFTIHVRKIYLQDTLQLFTRHQKLRHNTCNQISQDTVARHTFNVYNTGVQDREVSVTIHVHKTPIDIFTRHTCHKTHFPNVTRHAHKMYVSQDTLPQHDKTWRQDTRVTRHPPNVDKTCLQDRDNHVLSTN